MSHDNHDTKRTAQIGRAASAMIKATKSFADTNVVIITVEPCGCLNMWTNLTEPSLSEAVMRAASMSTTGQTRVKQ